MESNVLEKILEEWKFKSTVQYADELEIDIKDRGERPRYPSGLTDLDNLIWGFHKKELVVLSARPSQGKTSLALQLAWNLAKRKSKVVFVTLEMSPQAILERVFSNEMEIHGWKLRKGEGKETALKALDKFKSRLLVASFEIVDMVGKTVNGIEAVLHSLKPDFVFIDHLQLISSSGYKSKYEALSDYVSRLKRLSIEYDCGIIACSQINRAGSGVENAFDHLKGSGDIEECADTLLQCKWIGREDRNEPIEKYLVSVIKQRHGPTDKVHLNFDVAHYRFKDWSQPYDGK